MHGLRHKKLTSKDGATTGGNTQIGCSAGRLSNTVSLKRRRASAENSERSNPTGDSERSNAASVGHKSKRVTSKRSRVIAENSGKRSNAAGVNSETERRSIAAGVNSERINVATVVNSAGSNATIAAVNSDRINAAVVHSERVSAAGGHSERSSAAGGNSRTVASDVNIGRVGADGVNHGRIETNVPNSLVNSATDGVNSQLNVGRQEPAKRGRGKMSRTELKMAPRSGRIELEPVGHSQFKYVGYKPKGYKYPSQLGAILKREYPGIIKVYDDNGTIVKQKPAFSWNDYYWKKNRNGVSYARRVKQEFWSLYTVHPRHRARAEIVLENYLVRRVPNMMYQVRLEGVKAYFHKRKENCDDKRARTIELTEEQYLDCRVEWCSKAVWAWLSNYWTTARYKERRQKAQASRMNSNDPAQNRGGSRNFTETQQYLEFTFGPEKSGTLNTYAVMKSGINNVDSTGRSGPIPSQIAQKRLDDYKALAPDENSQELDGKALYTMGRGMAHGRVPIGDGAVEKASVLVHAKSRNVKPIDSVRYQRTLKENKQLKESNEILSEANSINREMIMRMYAEFGKEPPADLLQRLANLDARRHQATESVHADGDTDNNDNSDEDDDYSWHESNAGNGSLEDDSDDDDLESNSEDDDLEDDEDHLNGDDDHLDNDGDDPAFPRGDTDHSNDHARSKNTAMATDRSGTRASN